MKVRHYLRVLLSLSLGIALLAGCGGSGGRVNMTGLWTLTATNRANNNYTTLWVMDLVQSGASMSGIGYLEGVAVGSLFGTVEGSRFSFSLNIYSTYGGGFATFTGTATNDTFSGQYEGNAGGYGPFSGNKVYSLTVASTADEAIRLLPKLLVAQ